MLSRFSKMSVCGLMLVVLCVGVAEARLVRFNEDFPFPIANIDSNGDFDANLGEVNAATVKGVVNTRANRAIAVIRARIDNQSNRWIRARNGGVGLEFTVSAGTLQTARNLVVVSPRGSYALYVICRVL